MEHTYRVHVTGERMAVTQGFYCKGDLIQLFKGSSSHKLESGHEGRRCCRNKEGLESSALRGCDGC